MEMNERNKESVEKASNSRNGKINLIISIL